MTCKCLVMDEQPDSWTKDGKTNLQWKFILMDFSDGPRVKTPMEFSLPRKEGEAAPGWKDGFVNLTITEFGNMFAGAIRVRGTLAPWEAEVETVSGKAVAA